MMINIRTEIKKLIEDNKNLEPHLYDSLGVFGELPLSGINLKGKCDFYEAVDGKLNIYVS